MVSSTNLCSNCKNLQTPRLKNTPEEKAALLPWGFCIFHKINYYKTQTCENHDVRDNTGGS